MLSSSSASTVRRATIEADFGRTPRIPATGFIVFGLLTFWVYTVLRVSALVNEHVESRWREASQQLATAGVAADLMEKLRRRGFRTDTRLPWVAAGLFALTETIIVIWCAKWLFIGGSDLTYIVPLIAAAAALFYAATLTFVIWLARRIHEHEVNELAIRERGPEVIANDRIVPDETMVARWEEINNHVALFLIVAFAMTGAPVVAALLFSSGVTAAYPGLPSLLVLILAGVFHVWGTRLVLGLLNSHLAIEAAHSHAADSEPTAGVANAVAARSAAVEGAPAADDKELELDGGSGPFIFVSYKREDFERVRPLLLRIQGWGYRIWYDKGIPGGAEWDALIEDKLKRCAMLMFCISRSSAESKYCRREVKYVDQLNKPILSLQLEPVHLGHGLEMLLTQYQIIDTGAPDFAGQLERALRFLVGARH